MDPSKAGSRLSPPKQIPPRNTSLSWLQSKVIMKLLSWPPDSRQIGSCLRSVSSTALYTIPSPTLTHFAIPAHTCSAGAHARPPTPLTLCLALSTLPRHQADRSSDRSAANLSPLLMMHSCISLWSGTRHGHDFHVGWLQATSHRMALARPWHCFLLAFPLLQAPSVGRPTRGVEELDTATSHALDFWSSCSAYLASIAAHALLCSPGS